MRQLEYFAGISRIPNDVGKPRKVLRRQSPFDEIGIRGESERDNAFVAGPPALTIRAVNDGRSAGMRQLWEGVRPPRFRAELCRGGAFSGYAHGERQNHKNAHKESFHAGSVAHGCAFTQWQGSTKIVLKDDL